LRQRRFGCAAVDANGTSLAYDITVVARLDRAIRYSRASVKNRDTLEYWATRSRRVVTAEHVEPESSFVAET
jgi:hypothetical protein